MSLHQSHWRHGSGGLEEYLENGFDMMYSMKCVISTVGTLYNVQTVHCKIV